MASALLSRTLTGLRSVRSSLSYSQFPSISTSFLKGKPFYTRPNFVSLATPASRLIHCGLTSSSGTRTFTTQSMTSTEPVISVDWLHSNLQDPNVKVLDASWYMPDEQRNPLQEYQVMAAHFIDPHMHAVVINWAALLGSGDAGDRQSPPPIWGQLHWFFFTVPVGGSDAVFNIITLNQLPHMLPSEEGFAAAVSALGIQNKDGVVVYDGKGIFSAARVWWMFRVFGHDKVWVLDGGLPRWRASGYDVESSASGDAILKASAASEAIEKVYRGQSVGPTTFHTNFQPHLVWTLEQVKQNIEAQTHQQVDARSKPRFDGVAPEPRKGIRSGHVPGSKCIPFGQMLDGSQTLLPTDELIKRFEQAGISLDQPVVTSCGTGVTACILALGLHRLGKTDVPVYDGSWTEWGAHSETPVVSAA
ncbi:threonyl-tRNA synthetase [Asimina triloba]